MNLIWIFPFDKNSYTQTFVYFGLLLKPLKDNTRKLLKVLFFD